jgi:hypothetical protein
MSKEGLTRLLEQFIDAQYGVKGGNCERGGWRKEDLGHGV